MQGSLSSDTTHARKNIVWMRWTLLAAAAYNSLWGLWVGLFPAASFTLLGMTVPPYLPLWQSVGLMVGCYGIGYFIAAFDPVRYWPLVFVGFVGKVLGPLGMIYAVGTGQLPLAFAWNNLTNDVIWWVPFFLILRHAYRVHLQPEAHEPLETVIKRTLTNTGQTLEQRSLERPQLVVLLRHAGCTFCRETLSDLAKQRATLESKGFGIVLVGMSDDDTARAFYSKYGLEDVPRISDPTRALYKALELRRGRLGQLFGLNSWTRGWVAGVLNGHGIGWLEGDGFQMPGTFILDRGRVVKVFRHENASDKLDYTSFCTLKA